MAFRAMVTQFDKVSGWSKGPKKPSSTITEGSASEVKSAVTSAVNAIGDLAEGEVLIINVRNEG